MWLFKRIRLIARRCVQALGENEMEQINENKSYFIGMSVTSLVGAIATAFEPNGDDLPIVVSIPLTTVTVVIMSFAIGGLIVGVSWIITKRFSFTRLVKISTVVCVVWTIVSILSAMLNLGR
jgi:uncharacterized membrane protein YozB (DUF420 family)